MERRTAIKNLAFAVAGVLFVPGCDLWESREIPQGFLSRSQDELLRSITDTLIPDEESLPGALSLNVPAYVKIMLVDCRSLELRDLFFQGLEILEKNSRDRHNRSFSDLSPSQKEEMLRAMEISELLSDRQFFELLKGLTVQGYLTSEYVEVNFRNYIMVPGPIYGCTDISTI